MDAGAARARARCRDRHRRRVRTWRRRQAARVDAASRSRRGRCRTSSRGWCSPSSCIAPGRSCAGSRTTNERKREAGSGKRERASLRFAPNRSADRRCRARRAPASCGDWYRAAPRGGEWRAYAESVAGERVSTNWYDELAPAFTARGAAAERLQRSAGGQGIVVTTGQQPGLFGGPLMTLIKALSARALADATARRRSGIPVAPVSGRRRTTRTSTKRPSCRSSLDGRRARAASRRSAPPAGTPMARAPIDGAEVDAARRGRCARRAARRRIASYLEHGVRARIATARRSASAYVALLRDLLEPLGIAVLDASHPACVARRRRLLRAAPRTTPTRSRRRCTSAARRSSPRGFQPQVEEVDGLSLVFSNAAGRSVGLPIAEAEAFARADDDVPVVDGAAAPGDGARDPSDGGVPRRPGRGRVLRAGERGGRARSACRRRSCLPRWSATIVEPRVAANPRGVRGRRRRSRRSARARDVAWRASTCRATTESGAARAARRPRRRHRRAAPRATAASCTDAVLDGLASRHGAQARSGRAPLRRRREAARDRGDAADRDGARVALSARRPAGAQAARTSRSSRAMARR